MYRHFPSKLDLALAVFEENLTELEEIARDPDPSAFWRVWDRLVVMTIDSAAFVEIAMEARLQLPEYTGSTRLENIIGTTLRRAQDAAVAPAELTVENVLVTEQMVYGVVAATLPTTDAHAAVEAALSLVSWTASRPRARNHQ